MATVSPGLVELPWIHQDWSAQTPHLGCSMELVMSQEHQVSLQRAGNFTTLAPSHDDESEATPEMWRGASSLLQSLLQERRGQEGQKLEAVTTHRTGHLTWCQP